MKKKIMLGIILSLCILLVITAIGYRNYKCLMNDVIIVQYYNAQADNLDWQTVYIRSIVPENVYQGDRTINAIRLYTIIRTRNIPNRIDIVLYNDMEKLKACESYAEISLKK